MNIVVIRTQAELDALPAKFENYTKIEIRATERIYVKIKRENSSVVAWGNSSVVAWGNSSVVARENSSVVAWGNSSVVARENSSVVARENSSVVARENSSVVARENSSVVAWGNSSVVAWGNSSVVARENSSVDLFLCATLFVYSIYVTVKNLRDNSRLVYHRPLCKRPLIQDATAQIVEYDNLIKPTFEQWLERGYVVADGIHQKLVSQKTVGDVTIFEVNQFPKKVNSYVVKKGDKFAHGETIEKAKTDLRYKIYDRDTTKYNSWKLDDIKPVEQLIEAYMAITGACSMGTKMFCEETSVNDGEISIEMAIDLTKGRYGNEVFADFFNKAENVKLGE